MPDYTYVIIGGGMAAAAAITGIREVDDTGSIGVITAERTTRAPCFWPRAAPHAVSALAATRSSTTAPWTITSGCGA